MKEDNLIDKWLKQELPREEKEAMEKLIAFTEKLDVPHGKSQNEAWEQLTRKIEERAPDNEKIMQPSKPRRAWLWAAAAAIIALVIYVNFSAGNKIITVRAASGQLTTITLPDNSMVTLNAGTVMSYKEKNWERNRWVVLSGEAFFDITPGNEFKVIGDNYQVKVLGTSFNLYNRSKHLRVSVFTGTVEVSNNEDKVVLNSGEEALLHKDQLKIQAFDLTRTATWRSGSFYFDAQPLSQVVEELERQFNIKILSEQPLSERYYSGYFNTSNLNEALQLVFVPMGLKFSRNGDQVIVE
ncbi:FecR family protein [Roseivirga thermotolerans]|uniref:FecR family protein n=1 Tax=Roseivirga thermotolerans TaxID=1758176 RepID=UPI00273FA613|nr:FecR domain-containing protein [Roseivirga thermotolerans]